MNPVLGWLRRRCSGDAGSGTDAGASTLEFLIIAPILFTVSCLALQLGVWFLGSNAAHTAARKGAQAGAAYQSSPGSGASRAQDWLSQVGVLHDAYVSTAGSDPNTVKVTVTGRVLSFLPGWDGTIARSAEDAVERVQP